MTIIHVETIRIDLTTSRPRAYSWREKADINVHEDVRAVLVYDDTGHILALAGIPQPEHGCSSRHKIDLTGKDPREDHHA